MPPTDARPIDAAALRRTLQRLGRHPAPPWLHVEVARRMAERLSLIRLQPAMLVDWWAFLGGGGEALVERYPAARRVAVEPTAELQQRSARSGPPRWWPPRRWTGRHDAVAVLEADAEAAAQGAQLVWSNMMLHAVADPPTLIGRWQRLLAQDGFAMFSCFGPDTLRELTGLYRDLGWPPPTVPFVDLHDLGDMLVAAGFADPVMDQETITLTWADAQSMLAELRALGGNVSVARGAGLATPERKRALVTALEALAIARPDRRCALTFEITYGHAFKGAPKAALTAETNVSLDAMRSLLKKAAGGSR